MTHARVFIPLLTVLFQVPEAPAKPVLQDSDQGLARYLKQEHLFDDWFGGGPSMRERGFDFSGSFAIDFAANPTGGFSRGAAACTSLQLQLDVDLAKWLPWEGTTFTTSMIWRTGESLTNNRIGNLFSVTQLFGGSTIRLYEFSITQTLLDEHLLLKAGRIGAFDNFAVIPGFGTYVNNGFDGNPVGIFLNTPAFGQIVYPTSSWGVFAKWMGRTLPYYFQAGAYFPDSENGSNAKNGLNWTFNTDLGPAFLAETGYTPNANPGDSGLPALYAIGGYFSAARQPTFSTSPELRKNAAFYISLQQMVWMGHAGENALRQRNTFGPGAVNGLTLLSAIVVSPDESINAFPLYMNHGAIWQGLIPCRPDDFLLTGVAYGTTGKGLRRFQRDTGVSTQSYEAVVELSYRVQLTPFLYFQPDLQYVFNPGGTGLINDALVLAFQAGVTF